MSNSSSSKQILLSVIGIAILVVVVVGVTFAFFNYTRTGQANVIRTGQINFLTTQGTTLNLTDVFPIASNEVGNSNALTLRIEGDTTYTGGEEFEITFDSVNNTINNKVIPINYIATYTPTSSGENIGSEATNYFSERGSTNTVYELTETGIVEEGKQILVGYIPVNGDIDGTLTIRAYLDSSRIAITDTLEGTEEASAEYENGTTSTWIDERAVLTTTEWNALQNTQNPLSFRIKAVSQEGTWVEEPELPTIASCPGEGCVYTYTMNTLYAPWNAYDELPSELTSADYVENYEDVVNQYGVKSFFGLVLDNGRIARAYSCGIYLGNPFCIEGSLSAEKKLENDNVLYPLFGNFDNYVGCYDAGNGETICYSDQDEVDNSFSITNSNSVVRVTYGWDMCVIDNDSGTLQCFND